MNGTRYETLQAANQRARESFEEYENDCKQLIADLRNALIEYLDCPTDRVKWLRYGKNVRFGEGFIETVRARTMALFENTSYHFVLRIDFRPGEAAAGGWVDVEFAVRRAEGHFVVRLGEREEIIEKADDDQVAKLAKLVFDGVKEYIDGDFDSFLEGAEREGARESIGFARS